MYQLNRMPTRRLYEGERYAIRMSEPLAKELEEKAVISVEADVEGDDAGDDGDDVAVGVPGEAAKKKKRNKKKKKATGGGGAASTDAPAAAKAAGGARACVASRI